MRAATEAPASPAPTPESLVARYRTTGDSRALAALFDATAPSLFRIALSISRDAAAAEDALQETYLAALEHLDRYDATRPVTPWLIGILRVMVKRSRRDASRAPDPVRVAAAHGADDSDDGPAEKGEDAQRVRAAIDGLEEPYRAVALLRWRYGLSPAEIADVRGEPPGTVRSILSRGTEQLRAVLRGAPAFFLLPPGPRGLEGVRAAVLREAATIPLPAAAGTAGAAAGLSIVVKLGIAAAIVVAAGVGTWAIGFRGEGARGAGGRDGEHDERRATEAPAPPRDDDALPAAAALADGAAAPPTVAPAHAPNAAESSNPPSTSEASKPAEPTGPEAPAGSGDSLAPQHEPETQPLRPEPPPIVQGNDPVGGNPVAKEPPRDADADGVGGALATRIDSGVRRGVTWLRAHQRADGSWGFIEGNAAYGAGGSPSASGTPYTHPAGPTALALYALLKSGVPLDDPYVKRGFSYLRGKQKTPQGAYEASAMLLAVTATAEPPHKGKPAADEEKPRFPAGDWREWAQRLHDVLLDKRKAAKTLGWRYMVDPKAPVPPGGNEDLSSTQLAALALFAAERCGIRTESRVWAEILAFAMKQQEADGPAHPRAVDVWRRTSKEGVTTPGERPAAGATGGPRPTDRARGFAYILDPTLPPDEGKPTGGMTACGLATIEIARHVLAERDDRDGRVKDPTAVEHAIFDGLAWLDLHWSPFSNPGKAKENVYHLAYLYGVERAFDLLGNRRLGKHLWYGEMAEQLLARQSAKGFWDSESAHKPQEVLDTSFALLFLGRATRVIPTPSLTDTSDAASMDGR